MAERILPTGENSDLSNDQLLAAAQFMAQHIHTPAEQQASYRLDTIRRWAESLSHNKKPMWLRRSFEAGNELSVAVDYSSITSAGDQIVFASIFIDDRDIQLDVAGEPNNDGVREPVRYSVRPYSFESVALALSEAEHHVLGQIVH